MLRRFRVGYVDWCSRLLRAGRQIPSYALYRKWMQRRAPSFMVQHKLYQELE